MRESLPLALLLINAQIAARAAERGDADEARRHLQIIQEAGFEQSVVNEALDRAVRPIRERIKTLCKTAEPETDADPTHADRVARRLTEQTRSLLATLDCLFPETHSSREGAHDEVALRILVCQIAHGGKTENWKVSVELLETALSIVASESARSRIEDNLKIVKSNSESGNDWCGEGYYNAPAVVLAELERARESANLRKWDEAIAVLEAVLAGSDLLTAQVGERQMPLIHKALAYCLNLRAVDRLNAVMRDLDQPLPIMKKIAERAQFGGSGFALAATIARMASSGMNLPAGIALQCMACGTGIYGQYIRFTFRDVPVIVCSSCGSDLDRQQERRKSTLREAANAANRDLTEAANLDSSNKAIAKNMKDLRELCSNAGITLAAVETRIVRVPTELGCLNTGRPDPNCWFCHGERRAESASSIRVTMYQTGHTKKERFKKTI
jgi:hypothetical protein